MAKEQSDISRKAKVYLEKHQVEEIVSDMINTLTHHQLKNPIIYMIKYLARIHCTEKELEEANIKIDFQEQIEQPVICLSQSDLSKHLGSIKKHLNKDVFFQCKNKITPYGNNFRTINKIIQENPRSKIGLFAIDPGCYETYDQLFEMVLKDKYDTQPPEKYLHYKLPNSIFEDTKNFLDESVVIMRRNIHQYRFNATLQQRQQLTKELVELLQQQQIIEYTQKFDLGQMEKDDMKKLQLSDKLYKRKDLPNREANTIENQFKGLRHPDWPKDRMLLMNQEKNNIVWINKEDHLKFKSIANDKSFLKQIDNYIKINEFFLQKGLLSFDDKKYGYTTVKPQLSGLGMGFFLKYKFTDSDQFNKIKPTKEKLDKLPKNPFLITSKENKYLVIKFDKCAGYNLDQIIRLLCEVLEKLFEGIVQVSKDHVVIDIEQKQDEYIQYATFHNKRLSQLNRTKDTHKLIDISKLINQDGIYFGNNFVKDKFIIIRRNLKFMNIKLDEMLKLTDSSNQLDLQFITQAGLEIKQNQQGYLLNKDQYQYGLLLNYDDDFTWIFPIDKISISQQLNKINKIIQEFEYNLKQEYAYDQHLGYLNNENKYIGSGASIIINFNIDQDQLKKLNEINKIQNLVTIKQTYLILNNISDSNYQLFRELIINFLFYLKKQFNNVEMVDPSIVEQDCFIENKQLWAPTLDCFNKFSLIYQNYVKNKALALFIQLKKSPHRYIDNRDIYCKLQDKLQITCSFYRNFQNYQYPHEMSYSQLQNLKKELKDYLKENKFFDQSYQVKINKKHHLNVEFKTTDVEFIDKFVKTWSLLEQIEKKYPFQYDNTNLGYLGPVMNESLLEGFQLEIKMKQKDFNKYKDFGYSMEETGDYMYIYKSKRPCQIHIETEFLKGQ